MTAFRFANVLRARRIREDTAKAEVAAARNAAIRADEESESHRRELAEVRHPDAASAVAFFATARARQALASALTDAMAAQDVAELAITQRVEDLSLATTRRKALEQLAERHDAALRQAADEADQAALDDLTGARHFRNRTRNRRSA